MYAGTKILLSIVKKLEQQNRLKCRFTVRRQYFK